MRRVKFIYNPHSGENKIASKLDSIIKIYQENGYTVVPYRIDFDQDLYKAFDDEIDKFNHILVSGGDGTINRVVNIMKKMDIKLPMGILPSGTANDFARMLGISDNIEEVIHGIINNDSRLIDLGKINDDYFVNVASAGMFTNVSQKINGDFKTHMGKVSYYIKGIEEALNLRPFNILVESKEVQYDGKMYLMLVFNGKTAGNINLAYKSEIDDGLLDVIIFKAMPLPKSLYMFIKVMKQEHLEQECDIIYFRTKEVKINCKEYIDTDIDGEKGPNFSLDIVCIKDGLEILGIK